MKNNFFDGLVWGIICTALLAGVVSGFCAVGAYAAWERRAVERGAAEYVIADPKTGKVEFRWKDNK